MSRDNERLFDEILSLIYSAKSENALVDGLSVDDDNCIATVDRLLYAAREKLLTLKSALTKR
jgi:hypothetical protein